MADVDSMCWEKSLFSTGDCAVEDEFIGRGAVDSLSVLELFLSVIPIWTQFQESMVDVEYHHVAWSFHDLHRQYSCS